MCVACLYECVCVYMSVCESYVSVRVCLCVRFPFNHYLRVCVCASEYVCPCW